jgi:hypothetical protein
MKAEQTPAEIIWRSLGKPGQAILIAAACLVVFSMSPWPTAQNVKAIIVFGILLAMVYAVWKAADIQKRQERGIALLQAVAPSTVEIAPNVWLTAVPSKGGMLLEVQSEVDDRVSFTGGRLSAASRGALLAMLKRQSERQDAMDLAEPKIGPEPKGGPQ